MTRKLLARGLALVAVLGLLLAPAVGAQTTPPRVVQGSDGALYLAQDGNAWPLVPTPISDEDLAGLRINAGVAGAIVGQSSPLQVVQGGDGGLYLAQGGSAWPLAPDPIGDDDLAALSLGQEVDGSVPPALLNPVAALDVATATPGIAMDTPAPASPTATPVPPTATPVLPTETPVPPTATLAPTSTSTPMPTAVPTMTLYGSVTREGQPAANAMVRVLELSPLFAASGSDGSFRLRGLQQASYTLVAQDGDLTSSPLSIPQGSAEPPPFKIELVAAPGGQPSLFVGQVQGDDRAGAIVWRLGGAGQTKADQNGKFWLVDAHVDATGVFTASPTDAVIVAAKGNRWGFAAGPFKDNALAITLAHTGSPPHQPKGPLMNLKDKGDGTTIPQQGVDAVFTARWSGPPTEQGTFTPAGTSSVTGTCQGACKGVTAQGWAAFLPRGSTYALRLTTPDFEKPITTPHWAEAQVVAYPTP